MPNGKTKTNTDTRTHAHARRKKNPRPFAQLVVCYRKNSLCARIAWCSQPKAVASVAAVAFRPPGERRKCVCNLFRHSARDGCVCVCMCVLCDVCELLVCLASRCVASERKKTHTHIPGLRLRPPNTYNIHHARINRSNINFRRRQRWRRRRNRKVTEQSMRATVSGGRGAGLSHQDANLCARVCVNVYVAGDMAKTRVRLCVHMRVEIRASVLPCLVDVLCLYYKFNQSENVTPHHSQNTAPAVRTQPPHTHTSTLTCAAI